MLYYGKTWINFRMSLITGLLDVNLLEKVWSVTWVAETGFFFFVLILKQPISQINWGTPSPSQRGQADHQVHCGAGRRWGTLFPRHTTQEILKEDGSLDVSVYRSPHTQTGISTSSPIIRPLWREVWWDVSMIGPEGSSTCRTTFRRKLTTLLGSSSRMVILQTSSAMALPRPHRKQQTQAAQMRDRRRRRDHWWWYPMWLGRVRTSGMFGDSWYLFPKRWNWQIYHTHWVTSTSHFYMLHARFNPV